MEEKQEIDQTQRLLLELIRSKENYEKLIESLSQQIDLQTQSQMKRIIDLTTRHFDQQTSRLMTDLAQDKDRLRLIIEGQRIDIDLNQKISGFEKKPPSNALELKELEQFIAHVQTKYYSLSRKLDAWKIEGWLDEAKFVQSMEKSVGLSVLKAMQPDKLNIDDYTDLATRILMRPVLGQKFMYLADLEDCTSEPQRVDMLRLVPQGAAIICSYRIETSCFIMGGCRKQVSIQDVFNITTQGVITDKSPMLFARSYFALAKQAENIIYATGGLGDRGEVLEKAEAFMIDSREWKEIANLNKARMNHSSLFFQRIVNDSKTIRKVYVFSGIDQHQERVSEIESYPNGLDTRWTKVNMKQESPAWVGLRNLHLIQINNEQILAFGRDDQNNGWQIVMEQEKASDLGNSLIIRDEFLKENWEAASMQSSLLKYNKKIFLLSEKGSLLKIGSDGNVEEQQPARQALLPRIPN